MSTSEFILFGASVWFWIIFGVFMIALLLAERFESGTTATVSLVIFVLLVYKFGDWAGMKAFITSYISWYTILGYIAIGLIYCTFRFNLLGRKHGKKLLDNIQKYAKDNNLKLPLSEVAEEKFNSDYLYRVDELSTEDKIHRVIRWWLNWPASLLYWILSDMFNDLGKWLYNMFAGLFDNAYKSGKTATYKVHNKNK